VCPSFAQVKSLRCLVRTGTAEVVFNYEVSVVLFGDLFGYVEKLGLPVGFGDWLSDGTYYEPGWGGCLAESLHKDSVHFVLHHLLKMCFND
jgi:hypothetical protein